MKFKAIVAIAFFSMIAYTTQAQTAARTVTGERARIKKGVKTGELTKAETARLAAQTAKLKNDKKAIKADGEVTKEERKEYKQDKKKVGRRIYRQKHDGQTRP